MTNYRADYLTPDVLSSMPFKSLGHDVMIHERVTLVGIEIFRLVRTCESIQRSFCSQLGR